MHVKHLIKYNFFFNSFLRNFSSATCAKSLLTCGDEVEDAGLCLCAQLVARPTEDGPVIPSGVEAVDELRCKNQADQYFSLKESGKFWEQNLKGPYFEEQQALEGGWFAIRADPTLVTSGCLAYSAWAAEL